jgi:Squalene/phytoene synthase
MAVHVPNQMGNIILLAMNRYCHYVAGLVGIGLSDLWAASGLEGQEFAGEEVGPHFRFPFLIQHDCSMLQYMIEQGAQACSFRRRLFCLFRHAHQCSHIALCLLQVLSNHMGLFLQKTNIIRDYLEDIVEEPAPRMFWPREVWGKHADRLADFKVRCCTSWRDSMMSARRGAVQLLGVIACTWRSWGGPGSAFLNGCGRHGCTVQRYYKTWLEALLHQMKLPEFRTAVTLRGATGMCPGQYAMSPQEKAHAGAAVACLNELVTDALKHVPHCLAYMERVQDWHIFRFCAIPQVHV